MDPDTSKESVVGIVDRLKAVVNSEEFAKDVAKFDKGVVAAAGRIRKVMQEVKTVAQEVRTVVQAAKVKVSAEKKAVKAAKVAKA